MPLTESIHELLELGGTLDLEEDLVVVVSHLDVQVLCGAGVFRLAWATGAAVIVGARHFVRKCETNLILLRSLREAVKVRSVSGTVSASVWGLNDSPVRRL